MNGCDGALDALRPAFCGGPSAHLDNDPERFTPSERGFRARMNCVQHTA